MYDSIICIITIIIIIITINLTITYYYYCYLLFITYYLLLLQLWLLLSTACHLGRPRRPAGHRPEGAVHSSAVQLRRVLLAELRREENRGLWQTLEQHKTCWWSWGPYFLSSRFLIDVLHRKHVRQHNATTQLDHVVSHMSFHVVSCHGALQFHAFSFYYMFRIVLCWHITWYTYIAKPCHVVSYRIVSYPVFRYTGVDQVRFKFCHSVTLRQYRTRAAARWIHIYHTDPYTAWLNWAGLKYAEIPIYHAGVEALPVCVPDFHFFIIRSPWLNSTHIF